jgi:hypothetical protein
MDRINADTAICNVLHQIGARVDVPISLFDIGMPLVGQGYGEEEIINALFYLQSAKVLDLIDGNRLRLRSALTAAKR